MNDTRTVCRFAAAQGLTLPTKLKHTWGPVSPALYGHGVALVSFGQCVRCGLLRESTVGLTRYYRARWSGARLSLTPQGSTTPSCSRPTPDQPRGHD